MGVNIFSEEPELLSIFLKHFKCHYLSNIILKVVPHRTSEKEEGLDMSDNRTAEKMNPNFSCVHLW